MAMEAVKPNKKLRDVPNEVKGEAKGHDKNLEMFTWKDDLKLNENGGVKSRSVYNIKLFLENDGLLKDVIAYDEFSELVVTTRDVPELKIKKGYWLDAYEAILRTYFEEKYNLLFGRDNISDAVINVSREQTFNPVKDRIERVEWDGKPRAANYFTDYLGAENVPYTRAITKIWLTGAIARVYQPGVKFEIVPILEGSQGLGKSTAARNLFPDKFNDTLAGLGDTKDDYQQLQGSWIIEIAELSAMRKTEIEKMKNFISAMVDVYRASYGHYALPHGRKVAFIGTTNQTDYLKDATGERRFYPIKCGVSEPAKNVWKPDQNDISQILAEAKCWYDNKEPLYPDKDVVALAKPYQENAKAINLLEEAIKKFVGLKVPDNWDQLSISDKQVYFRHDGDMEQTPWLKSKISNNFVPLNHTTTTEILAVIFNKTMDNFLTGRINSDGKKIKLIMDNMDGWKPQRIRIKNKQVRGYVKNM